MTLEEACKPLTLKQSVFVREYLKDLNGTQAYRRAGFRASTDNVAASMSHVLLRKPKVAAAVAAGMAERAQRTTLDADRVITEIGSVAFSRVIATLQMADGKGLTLEDLKALPDAVQAAIAAVEFEGAIVKKVRFWDKPRALELAAKHLGLVKDRVQLEDERLDFEGMPMEDLLLVKGVLERQKARQDLLGRKKEKP